MPAVITKKYRILMFSPIFAPFGNPEAIVNNKLALSFMKKGWHVDVITRAVPDMYGYKYGALWEDIWTPLKDVVHEVEYDVGGLFYQKIAAINDGVRMGYLMAGCRWAAHAYEKAIKLLEISKYDVIMSRALPDAAHMPALKIARQKNIPWIANWNDPSGDKNPPPGGTGPDARLGYFHDRLLDNIARSANWITCPTERMRRYLCKYLGSDILNRSCTVPHVAANWKISSEQHQNSLLTLCHAGNLYPTRNPSKLLKALKRCCENPEIGNDIRLDVIGIENVDLKMTACKYGVDHLLRFTGPMSYTDTLQHLDKCDVLIVIEAPCEDGIYLPSKFVDYVQVGRPILAITPRQSTLTDIISHHGGGMAVDCNNEDNIYSALNELHAKWKAGLLFQQYNSKKLYALFSPEVIAETYEHIFSRIILC